MNNRTIVSWVHRCGSLRLRFLGRVRRLPFAQRGPAFIVCAAQDGGVAHGYALFLYFIDNAVIERHGLWRGFINTSVMEAAFVQDGHGKEVSGDDAGRVSCDLNHGGGPQLMRLATLRKRGGNGRRTYQHEHRTGQEPASAI